MTLPACSTSSMKAWTKLLQWTMYIVLGCSLLPFIFPSSPTRLCSKHVEPWTMCTFNAESLLFSSSVQCCKGGHVISPKLELVFGGGKCVGEPIDNGYTNRKFVIQIVNWNVTRYDLAVCGVQGMYFKPLRDIAKTQRKLSTDPLMGYGNIFCTEKHFDFFNFVFAPNSRAVSSTYRVISSFAKINGYKSFIAGPEKVERNNYERRDQSWNQFFK